jgi:hypothetical protein
MIFWSQTSHQYALAWSEMIMKRWIAFVRASSRWVSEPLVSYSKVSGFNISMFIITFLAGNHNQIYVANLPSDTPWLAAWCLMPDAWCLMPEVSVYDVPMSFLQFLTLFQTLPRAYDSDTYLSTAKTSLFIRVQVHSSPGPNFITLISCDVAQK